MAIADALDKAAGARMTVPSANGAEGPVADRAALKRRLFALWDQDSDGALRFDELQKLARATGFEGTDEDWAEEYPVMCAEKGCTPEAGLSEAAVMALLDDDSDVGCYFTDQELQEILAEAGVSVLREVGALVAEASSPGHDREKAACTAEAADMEPEVPAPSERCDLKRKLFALWDKDRDGALRGEELLKLARATGYDGSEEDWAGEYPEMCAEKGCSPETGMSEDAVMALLDDQSDTGCYFSDQELREILAEAGDGAALGGAAEASPELTIKLREDREALKRRLFRLWDQDKDGALKEDEMMQVALATGFDGSDEEWRAEFAAMCEEHKVQPEAGFSKAYVLALLDDQSDQGAYMKTEDIKSLIKVLAPDDADPEEEIEFKVKVVRMEDGKAGFNVRQADMVVSGLSKPQELHPMENGDVVIAVNGTPVGVYAEYAKLAHGVPEFWISLRRPREFQEADKWEGTKPGYAFKRGHYGLGYYRDVCMGVHTLMTGVQEFHPALRFRGEWAGHVFKMGHLGLGYYLDTVSRTYMKKRLFALWDLDHDGRLNKQEACQFARDTGFNGTFDEFLKEFATMCATRSCSPAEGLSESAIMEMLDDKTDRGCHLSGDELEQLIARIERVTAGKAVATGSSVPLAELPPARLKALARLHSVSLQGCVEKADIVDALRKAGVGDQGAAAVAAAAEKHLGAATEGVGAAERGALEKKVSLCDDSGSLKKDSVVKMAECVGWVGPDENWVEKFTEVFNDHAGVSKEAWQKAITVAAVMTLAEATKSQLLEKGIGCADIGEDGQPAKKRPKVMLPPEKKKVEKQCEACEKDPKDTASVFCSNCKAFLCQQCNEDNHSTKLLKRHTRLMVDGLTPLPVIKVQKNLQDLTVGELKALAKKHGTSLQGCVEKKDLIGALERAGVRPPEEPAEEAKNGSEAPKGAPAEEGPPKVVAPPPKKEGDIRPPASKSNDERESRFLEIYVEHRAKMGPGSQWELLTGVALWRNDWGWERTFFINATTPRGWPNVIEVLEYGERRLKVRGMGVDRASGTLVGQRWQMGWLEIGMLLDKDSGELLVQPNTQTGQLCQPVAKGNGAKVLPPKGVTQAEKDKEAASVDPEVGAAKPEGLAKKEVFKSSEQSEY